MITHEEVREMLKPVPWKRIDKGKLTCVIIILILVGICWWKFTTTIKGIVT
jgi:hypothetical protein